MEFKQVKEVSPIEEKSTQEVEQNLLDKHEESLKVSDVNENVSETSNTVKETTIEENKAEQDIADLPEIKRRGCYFLILKKDIIKIFLQ